MDKEISTAFLSGAGASVVTALITGLFTRGRGSVDLTISDRTIMQKEKEILMQEAKILRDELRKDNSELESKVVYLESRCRDFETQGLERHSKMMSAVIYWMREALRGKPLDSFVDYPVIDDLKLLYDAARVVK